MYLSRLIPKPRKSESQGQIGEGEEARTCTFNKINESFFCTTKFEKHCTTLSVAASF